MKEEWKDVPGFEGYYLVSSLGRVYSVRSEKILKQKKHTGYNRVNLSVCGHAESWSVHRLVALAFIPNPECKPTVNHINEIKSDNRVENLEWATIKEQNVHGSRTKRAREHTDYKARNINYKLVASKHDYKHIAAINSKPVSQFKKDGTLVRTYASLKEASGKTNVRISKISACINNKGKTAGGWIWKVAT